MKVVNLIWALILLVLPLAQAEAQTDLIWETDLKIARERADTEGKSILLVFSGSDWCRPCMKLEKEIWQTQKFKGYARKQLIVLKADFPRRNKNRLTKKNAQAAEELARLYNSQGKFPLVLLLDHNGQILGRSGYISGGPDSFIRFVEHTLNPNSR